MHSLVRFCYLAAEGTFTTRDLYPQTLQALQVAPEEYKLGSLTAGILQPFAADQSIPKEKITALDRRYTAVIQALDDLVEAVGLKAA